MQFYIFYHNLPILLSLHGKVLLRPSWCWYSVLFFSARAVLTVFPLIGVGFLSMVVRLFNDYKEKCRIVSKQEIGKYNLVNAWLILMGWFRWRFAQWRNETAREENRGWKKWNLTIKG